jgi:hypothetical protein
MNQINIADDKISQPKLFLTASHKLVDHANLFGSDKAPHTGKQFDQYQCMQSCEMP